MAKTLKLSAAKVAWFRANERRFTDKVDKSPWIPGGCHLWTAGKSKDGYGYFSVDGVLFRAHRLVVLLSGTKIPSGRIADHICNVRCCVNRIHLQVITQSRNNLRGRSPATAAARLLGLTHCAKGHPFSEGNTRICRSNGQRICKTCRRDIQRRYRGKPH